jgi:outer membrane protein assembly factor BamB
MNGDSSAPAVHAGRVFVAYRGPQVYAFDALSGTPAWHYSGCCEGGGGWAPAVYGGRVYARDTVYGNHVFDEASGHDLGGFGATAPPAFTETTGLFRSGSTLVARSLDSGATRWSFSGDGQLDTPPIVANGIAYVGSSDGNIYGIDIATGRVAWSDALPGPVNGDNELQGVFIGLSASDGVLTVPSGNSIVAYTGSAGVTGPSPTGTAGDSSSPGSGTVGARAARRSIMALAPILRRDARRVIRTARSFAAGAPVTPLERANTTMRHHLRQLSTALRRASVSRRVKSRIQAAERTDRRVLKRIAHDARHARRLRRAIETLAGGTRKLSRAVAALKH